MSVQPTTRAAASNRWIRAALAAFVLASGASLLAQTEQKDKEKKPAPAPAHKTTPPPANKTNTPAPSGGQTYGHPGAPPPNTQSQHPTGNPPATPQAVHPTGNQPGYTPPARPTGNQPGYTPSGRPANGNQANPNDRPRPSYGSNPGGGRPGFTPGASAGNRPVYHGANGAEVHYRANGQPQMVRAHGMEITHSPSGVARAEYMRPDHSVIVTQGAHYGYVQRPFVVNNVSYVQRTYIVGGVTYGRFYRPYGYHGISLNLYVSSRYYAPGFYGWAYTPWARPVVYSFGWGPRPWFGFYAGYFAPYPTYAGPAYWLTDYMIAMTLQDAYQQQQAAAAVQANAQYNASYGATPGGQPALTPDVKQAIADEVHRQLDQERMEGQGGAAQSAPAFLADNATHVFVVANGLDVQSRSGECTLTEGDVLQMGAPPAPNSAVADLAVMASKGQDCRKGSVVSVAIADLQDMQNHMRETLDQGLAELQKGQGQNGIPALPSAVNRPPVDAPFVAAAPPPDPNIAAEVSQQAESASQAESEALSEAQASPADAGVATQSVSLGMTIDQVVGIMGQPQVKADLGAKKIYTYGNMKIIFMDGKVTDVQ